MARPDRDTYLGSAAAALAAGYLVAFAAAAALVWPSLPVPGHALLRAGELALAAGFAVIATAFRKESAARASGSAVRASRLRAGAFVLAGAYFLILAASALPPFSRFSVSIDSASYVGSRVTLLASYLALAVAAIMAAYAFAPGPRTGPHSPRAMRNRRLGLASIAFAAGSGLLVLSTSLSQWGLWAKYGPVPFDALAYPVADAVLMVAGIVAAVAFLGAARRYESRRGDEYGRGEAFRHRDGLLGIAALTLFLASALQVAATLSLLRLPAGAGTAGMVHYALTWLSGLALVAAPLLAAVGFIVCRHVSGKEDAPRL